MNFICGTGKTITFIRHALETNLYNRIIVLSPTRSLADQNKTKFDEDLEDHWISILVDCDGNDSTRNIDFIKKKWNRQEANVFISSTFHSARDVLNEVIFSPQSHTDSEKTLIIVDEAHNLSPKDIKMLSMCKKCLLVTATPPQMLQEDFNGDGDEEDEENEIINPWTEDNLIYSYSLSQAIKDGYICDYEVYIPNVEVQYEQKDELYAKSKFLAEGMLRKNCKGTIVYCNSTQECMDMEPLIKQACNELHFDHQLDIFTLSYKTSPRQRNDIFNNFSENDGRYKIILSVKILNEGIDLIKTDSIFITNPNDKEEDWKRTVQRMCRAIRKDEDNPDKIARIFIWSPDATNIPKCFQVLKEIDVTFFSKLKILNSGFYDESMDNSKTCNEFIGKEFLISEKTRAIFSVKCMTVTEKYDYYLDKTEDYFRQHGRMPPRSYIIPESGSRLGFFLNHVKFNSTRLSEAQKKRLLNMKPDFFVSRTKLSTPRIVQELLKFEKKHKRLPYSKETIILEEDGNEFKIGQHWEMIKRNRKPDFTEKLRQDILNVVPKAFDKVEIEIEQIVDKFLEFEEINKRWPLRQDDKMEINGVLYSIGQKFRAVQLNPRKYLSEELIQKLEERDSLWTLTSTERTTLKKIEKCFEFYKKNNERWPKREENKNYPLGNGETFDIGRFWDNVKKGTTKISEESHKEIVKLDSTIIIKIKRQ